MRVLGIDPGLRIAGYGCIDLDSSSQRLTVVEAGAIRMRIDESVPFRLLQLFDDISEIIKDTSPELFAVETIFTHRRQVSTATVMGHARGVILLAGQQASLPLMELTPTEIKKSVTGTGRATKEQVQVSVARLLHLKDPPEPTDVSDALAIAVTAAMRTQMNAKIYRFHG